MALPVLGAALGFGSSVLSFAQGRSDRKAGKALMQEQLAGLRQQREQGDALYNRYTKQFAPLEGEYIAATKAGMQPDYAYGAARARYETERSFDRGNAQAQRELRRLGIDPSSPRYQSLMREMRLRKATTMAGAVNANRVGERDRARDVGFQRLGSAVQMGRGLLSPAITSQNMATSGIGQMAGMYGARESAAMQDVGEGLNTGMYWLNRSGVGGGQDPQTQPWSPSSYYLPAAPASGFENASVYNDGMMA